MNSTIKKKKSFQVPHVYVMLVLLMLFSVLATYIVPSGTYERAIDENTKREIVVDGTYKTIEKNPIRFMEILTAIPKGIVSAGDIVVLVIIAAASLEIVNATGAINSGIYRLIQRYKKQELFILIGATVLFSALGAFNGWAEASLIFIPIMVSMTLAMGYDSLLGVAILILGCGGGFVSGVLNVYTTGISQAIAGLPIYSGIEFRLIGYVIFTLMGIVHIVSYAKKIKKDPSKSYVYGINESTTNHDSVEDIPEFTNKRKIIVSIVIIGFTLIAVGTIKWGWYLHEMSGVFLLIGISSGLVGRLGPDGIAKEFSKGASVIIPAALTIGIARSVLIILERGMILDTLVYNLSSLLIHLPGTLSAVFILIASSVLDFFITSASGKAVTMMPILMPVGEIIGINKQVITLAFQYGDGFFNYFYPTSGLLMAGLAMANVPWEKWVKFVWKLIFSWFAVSIVLVIIAQTINLGPF